MIYDDPVLPVQSLLERQVADPGRFFRQTALTPVVVVIGLQRYVRVEQPARQSPQQQTRHQPVQITLVGENHFGFRQRNYTPETNAAIGAWPVGNLNDLSVVRSQWSVGERRAPRIGSTTTGHRQPPRTNNIFPFSARIP